METPVVPRVSLGELFRTFCYIGVTGFGGGMAIVAVTERVCVQQKRWIGQHEFLHGLAFGQIIGPFSLNTCTFVGAYLRGTIGGIVAAVGFILPSALLMTLLSWLYFRYHQLPQLQSALRGTNPVIIALILLAAASLGKSKVKSRGDWALALAAFAAFAFAKLSALAVLAAALVWALGRSLLKREHT